jgi:hypothetical protein
MSDDQTLVDHTTTVVTTVPMGAFADVLIPYEGLLHLFKNASGNVAGVRDQAASSRQQFTSNS